MKATTFAILLSSFVTFSAVHAFQSTQPVSATANQPVLAKIDLNKADVKSLTGSFKGIGQKRAEAIVQHRESHGAFKSVSDLAAVRGLGKAFVDNHLTQLQAVFSVS